MLKYNIISLENGCNVETSPNWNEYIMIIIIGMSIWTMKMDYEDMDTLFTRMYGTK